MVRIPVVVEGSLGSANYLGLVDTGSTYVILGLVREPMYRKGTGECCDYIKKNLGGLHQGTYFPSSKAIPAYA